MAAGVGVSTPPPLPNQLPGKTPASEEQKAKWRAKYHARKNRQAGATVSPFPGSSLPPLPGAPDPLQAQSSNPPPVSWVPDTLKPLFEQLVPALEKANIESLKSKAAKLSAEALEIVEKDAGWNTPSKTTIITTGPEVTAKWLNAAGIGAENAAEVALFIAVGSIVAGQMVLASKLDQLAAKGKPEQKNHAPA